MLGSGVLAALLAFGLYTVLTPAARRLTQDDIDGAVLHTLKKQPPAPSQASRAYDVIRPSVVLVRRLGEDKPKKFSLTGVGTGVVFSEDGMIFTNLHVVAGADDIGVTFADGTESEVELLDAQPENDLAVLKAKTLPDDLRPATLRSTRGLKTGDEVLAVGFPFGIGPTATWGVVSGLRREHYSEQGRRNLVDLIQFDAATNPGNSGGPLVTREGDVVGIVTSILNPTDESFFVGIAFAVPIENAARAAGVSPF
jgi:S1-C subfamily serine protease